jgi:hypothetical protein
LQAGAQQAPRADRVRQRNELVAGVLLDGGDPGEVVLGIERKGADLVRAAGEGGYRVCLLGELSLTHRLGRPTLARAWPTRGPQTQSTELEAPMVRLVDDIFDHVMSR